MDFRTESEAIRSEIARIERNIDSKTVDSAQILADITSLGQSINRLGTYLADSKREIAGFDDKQAIIQGKVDYNYYSKLHNDFQAELARLNSKIKQDDNKKNSVVSDLEKWKKRCKDLENRIDRYLKQFLISDLFNEIEVINIFQEISTELNEIQIQGNNIKGEIEKLKGDIKDGISVKEIEKRLKELRAKVAELKRTQIERYNVKVTQLNTVIADLKGRTDLSQDILDLINSLGTMNTCNVEINWQSTSYYSELKYKELVEKFKIIDEVYKKMGKGGFNIKEFLNLDLGNIKGKISALETKLPDGTEITITEEEKSILSNDISEVSNDIALFITKYESIKDQLTENDRKFYEDEIKKAQEDVKKLRERLEKTKIKEKEDETPTEEETEEKKGNDDKKIAIIEARLKDLKKNVERENIRLDGLKGNILDASSDLLNDIYNSFARDLIELFEELRQLKGNKKIELNQFEKLKEQVAEIKDLIAEGKNKLSDFEYYKDEEPIPFFEKEVSGLSKRITYLENVLKRYDDKKVIRDKNLRKWIENEIETLQNNIEFLREQIEKNQEKNPEKCQELMNELDRQEERLKGIRKKYKSKCPFLVKLKKSAVEFYKKHPKLVLFSIGLASICLLQAHLATGLALIPAIMHGNIVLGTSFPALNGIMLFLNKILGAVCGAKYSAGAWYLMSGVRINASTTAATSLLRAVPLLIQKASVLIAALIAAIAALRKKMKNKEIKKAAKETKKASKDGKKDKKKKEKYVGKYEKPKEKMLDKFKKLKEELEKISLEQNEEMIEVPPFDEETVTDNSNRGGR